MQIADGKEDENFKETLITESCVEEEEEEKQNNQEESNSTCLQNIAYHAVISKRCNELTFTLIL